MQRTCVLQYFGIKTICYCIVKLIMFIMFIIIIIIIMLLLFVSLGAYAGEWRLTCDLGPHIV